MKKDNIFQKPPESESFQFNDKVAEVFDDMLNRSVPCYTMVIDMLAKIFEKHLAKGDSIYDLGCSTGNTLIALARRLAAKELTFIGLDNSGSMIEKARKKTEMYSKRGTIDFAEQDITETVISSAGGIILNYTMQFLRPMQRADFMRRIYASLKPGGILILSEKIIIQDSLLNRDYIDFYLQFKREQGYSELEIAHKREALENVLIPFSIEENRELLRQAGFEKFATFFQWFNFVSFVAVKEVP